MPIADTVKLHVELDAVGIIAAKGSSSIISHSIWHFRRTATVNPLVKANIEAAFQTAIMVPVTNALNESYTQLQTEVRMLEDSSDPYLIVARTVPGAITGDRMPPDKTAFLLAKSTLRGRRYMGRKLLSPMSESDSTAASADLFNAAAQTRLNAIGTAWAAGFTDSDGNVWVPVTVSKKFTDWTAVPVDVQSADIVQVLLNQRIGRFKRRQVKSVY